MNPQQGAACISALPVTEKLTMRKFRLTLLISLLMAVIAMPGHADSTAPQLFPLLEVEDGDTLIVEIEGKPERIQLLGIDAPENTHNAKFSLDLQKTGFADEALLRLGQAAASYLQSLVSAGQALELQADLQAKDRYGRIPAKVFNPEGRDLAEEMILGGFAVALPNETMEAAYVERFDRLERFARKKGKGLWGSDAQVMNGWYDRTR